MSSSSSSHKPRRKSSVAAAEQAAAKLEPSITPVSIARAEMLWNDTFAGIVEEKNLTPDETKFVLGTAASMWKAKVSRACLASGLAVPEDPAAQASAAMAQSESQRILALSRELGALAKQAENYRKAVPAALRERLAQHKDGNIESLEQRVSEFDGKVPELPSEDAGQALPVHTAELLGDTERRMKVAAERVRETQLALNSLSKKTERLANATASLVPGGVKRSKDSSSSSTATPKKKKARRG